jgi:hypothetical protein
LKAATAVWPGLALAVTFVDDFLVGPVLAATGLLFGVTGGFVIAVAVFTLLVGTLCVTSAMAVAALDGPRMDRLHASIESARQRRHVGRFVDIVGDDRLPATAIVAMVVSPVFAVLAARLSRPRQSLRPTILVATLSYSVAFSLTYGGGGAFIGSWL